MATQPHLTFNEPADTGLDHFRMGEGAIWEGGFEGLGGNVDARGNFVATRDVPKGPQPHPAPGGTQTA